MSVQFTSGIVGIDVPLIFCYRPNAAGEARVADIGCGKGTYLKNLYQKFPKIKCIAVDFSETVMQYINYDRIDKKRAIKEMSRVAKRGEKL